MFDGIFATSTAAVVSSLTTNLPLVLAVFAGLVGLGISIRYLKRWVGRK